VDAPAVADEVAEVPEADVVAVPDAADEAVEVDAPAVADEVAEVPEADVVAVPDAADEAVEMDAPAIADEVAEVDVPPTTDGATEVPRPETVSLVKTPPGAEALAAKYAQKEALLGNRTSPEEKAGLLGNRTSPEEKAGLLENRTSSDISPIAIGLPDGETAVPEVDVVVVPDVADEAAEVDAPMIDEETAALPEVDVVVVPDVAMRLQKWTLR